MKRTNAGFTLIELLVVVSIMAVLAGAAVPYVQDYVEDARIAKAKADMSVIKNALAIYEAKRGVPYTLATVASLSGFMNKIDGDPWGAAYAISTGTGEVVCAGPDGAIGGTSAADDFKASYQPPLAMTNAYWIDLSGDGFAGVGDCINVTFNRPATGTFVVALGTDDIVVGTAGSVTGAAEGWIGAVSKTASFTISAGTQMTPGKTTVTMKLGSLVKDFGGVSCIADSLILKTKY